MNFEKKIKIFFRSSRWSTLRQAQDELRASSLPAEALCEGWEGYEHLIGIVRMSRIGFQPPSTRTNSLFVFMLILSLQMDGFLPYDRAIVQGQKGNWQSSTDLLKQELSKNHNDPQVLYDTGVSSYKNGDYEHAVSYFLKAADSSQAPTTLQEQALFNAGNAHVSLKQLEQAISTFERVLALNPHNAKAAHNKEVVKKMLEEQKRQQQQKQDTKEDSPKEDSDQQQKNDQSSHDKNKEDQKTDKQDAQNQADNKKEEDNKSKSQSSEQRNKDAQEEQKQSSQEQSKKAQNETSQVRKEKEQQSQSASAQDAPTKDEKPEQQMSATTARLLDEREKKDAQLNKQLMRMMVGSQNAGADHNEHYW